MNVVMAPDWRAGNPYQRLLADGLVEAGVNLQFLSHYRRGLPLSRGLKGVGCDLLHLHWPEAYFERKDEKWGWLREWRFPLDLWLATRRLPYVATAHNLYPHNRGDCAQVRRNAVYFYRNASRIITHAPKTATILASEFGVDPDKCLFVPHGDIAQALRPLAGQLQARSEFGWDQGRMALMFGAVEPYKGIEEVIDFWNHYQPDASLVIVGRPVSEEYAEEIRSRAARNPRIACYLEWLPEATLALWLAACDAVVFNYRKILVSGAALMARQLGISILLPERLESIELGEPSPSVFRFGKLDESFLSVLEQALNAGRAEEGEWQEGHGWGNVAARTLQVYESALATHSA